jgi:hypothetical protein
MNHILCDECVLAVFRDAVPGEKTCTHGCYNAKCIRCGKQNRSTLMHPIPEETLMHCFGGVDGNPYDADPQAKTARSRWAEKFGETEHKTRCYFRATVHLFDREKVGLEKRELRCELERGHSGYCELSFPNEPEYGYSQGKRYVWDGRGDYLREHGARSLDT